MSATGFGEVGELLRRSTVQIVDGNRGAGSGVIWSAQGLIITNAHVVRRDAAAVQLWDGRRLMGEVVARDQAMDLAALKVRAPELPAARWGDSSAARPGELVLAVGNPFGFAGAFATGVIHMLGPLRGLGPRPWVQAAVHLGPGNSGGPLADARGRVIGINTMLVYSGILSGGLALAIPSNSVVEFLRARAEAA